MDKYDLLLILHKIREFYRERDTLYHRYLLIKKDWILRYYYALRMKKSSEYRKKQPAPKMENVIHKAGVLK